MPGLNSLHNVKGAAHQLNSTRNKMLVGHLPFLEHLVSYLKTGSPDRPVVKFQNGGVVCLDRQQDTKSMVC